MSLGDYTSFGGNGQDPLLNIQRVSNGWIVTVHHQHRERETSPETLAKQQEQREQQVIAQKEAEKQRIIRDLKLQMANMSIIGDAAAKAQHKSIEEVTEPWKEVEDSELSEDNMQKIEEMAQRIVDENPVNRNGFYFGGTYLADPIVGASEAARLMRNNSTETHIFTDRQKMIAFVTEMLQPLVE